MRDWMKLVEELDRWDRRPRADGKTDYEYFLDRYLDVLSAEPSMEEPLSEADYNDFVRQITRALATEPLFRGIYTPLSALDGHLGVYWSRDPFVAKDFAQQAAAGNNYDDRFPFVEPDQGHKIVITIEPVDVSRVDMVETVLSHYTTGEMEVTLLRDTPVVIRQVAIDGKVTPLPCVGQQRST